MSAATSRKLGGVGRAGLGGAPRTAEAVASPTGSSKPASSAPPRPVQYTLRLSYDESDRLADTARRLRRELGRGVEQSDVLRALVDLAATDDVVHASLAERIRDL